MHLEKSYMGVQDSLMNIGPDGLKVNDFES